jgi:phosphoribosylformylglycinamidine (FGAM) synthase-like enzyme
LATALAECSFGPEKIGADIDLATDVNSELLLFNESPSRILVATSDPESVLQRASGNNIEAVIRGRTKKSVLLIRNRADLFSAASVDRLRATWSGALEETLATTVFV